MVLIAVFQVLVLLFQVLKLYPQLSQLLIQVLHRHFQLFHVFEVQFGHIVRVFRLKYRQLLCLLLLRAAFHLLPQPFDLVPHFLNPLLQRLVLQHHIRDLPVLLAQLFDVHLRQFFLGNEEVIRQPLQEQFEPLAPLLGQLEQVLLPIQTLLHLL